MVGVRDWCRRDDFGRNRTLSASWELYADFSLSDTEYRYGAAVSLSYDDKGLVAIAASLAGGPLLGVVTAYSYRVGLLVGALVATVFVYDAIFRNPPQPDLTSRTTYAAIVWHLFVTVLAFPFLQ